MLKITIRQMKSEIKLTKQINMFNYQSCINDGKVREVEEQKEQCMRERNS